MKSLQQHEGTSLEAVLDSIGMAFGFDADALIEHAATDPHGGYHDKYDDGFPTGSVWRVEGQTLYAIVRELMDILPNGERFLGVELGTHYGCSATHIAQAIHDSGGNGTLVCVDLNGAAGNLIPPYLLRYVELVRGDMFDYLAKVEANNHNRVLFDFMFEDGSHGTEDVNKVWRAAYTLLKPGGVIITHDAEHWHVPSNSGVGPAVREGIARAGYFGMLVPARTYKAAPSDCGFAIWRKPINPSGIDTAVHTDALHPYQKRKNEEIALDDALVPSIGELLAPPDLSAMTIAELKAFANQRNIVLTGARTKGEIIAAIEAVL